MPSGSGGRAPHNNGPIVLASSSPRRRALLEQINVRFQSLDVDVDEEPRAGEAPQDYVIRLALAKARAGRAGSGRTAMPVLGADTAVVIDGEVLGKPRDRAHGLAMLARLSGATHTVMTAVALVGTAVTRGAAAPVSGAIDEAVRLSTSHVTFRPLTPGERALYWDSGEPVDKAGGYAIQGLAAKYIMRIDGSYSGIVGLPLFETAELLEEFGVRLS